ncbi:ubiquinone biosynthesis accessory factor UbiJ [Lacisediminimonas profundi]|uniref:ubiquinone biosynthesis accessory factor UbiJ n=1 Tax=Lacisediminimonas profundi TaxID=2603856 RepID=UPI00124B6A0B|nr:SCP2 sterol-binding domain-containing protein [Lacisediminimonas profundi]
MTPSLIAAAINHLLEQDAAEKSRLAAHAGKIARIDAGVADLRLAVEAGGAVSAADPAAAPDVSIFIKAGDLPLLLQDRTRAFSHVRIEGDAEFASVLSQLLTRLRWDAEEDLSRVFGDLAAVRIAGTARKGWDAVRSVHVSVMENMAEYLLEENPTLVRQQSLRDFGAAVSELRDDVERLAKRLDKLKGRA